MKFKLIALLTLTLFSCSKQAPIEVKGHEAHEIKKHVSDANAKTIYDNIAFVDDIAEYTVGSFNLKTPATEMKLYAVLSSTNKNVSEDELKSSFPSPILNRTCGSSYLEKGEPATFYWRSRFDIADHVQLGQLLLAYNASLSCVAEIGDSSFTFEFKTSPSSNCCYGSSNWESLNGKTVLLPTKTVAQGIKISIEPQSDLKPKVPVAKTTKVTLKKISDSCQFKTPVLPLEPNKNIVLTYQAESAKFVSVEHASSLPECRIIKPKVETELKVEGTCEKFASLYALPQLCVFRAKLEDEKGAQSEVAVHLSLPPRETLGSADKPQQCKTGTTRCIATTEQVCAADGYSWLNANTQSERCGYKPKTCHAGIERCYNGDLQVCNQSGSAFEIREKNSLACGTLLPQICSPGQMRCNAATKEECSSNGYAWNILELQSPECGDSSQACVANQESCFGTTRLSCKANGSAFEPKEYNSRKCGYLPPESGPKICMEGWKGCWSDSSYRECSLDGKSWKLNLSNDKRCVPGTDGLDQSVCTYLDEKCVGYNYNQCLALNNKTYWKNQGYIVKVGSRDFPCGRKEISPPPTISPPVIVTVTPPPRNSVVPRHPNNPAESRILYKDFDVDYNRWSAISEAFDLLLYLTTYNSYYDHIRHIQWGGSAQGPCALNNVGGFASSGNNFFTWCLQGALRPEQVTNPVRDNHIVYRGGLIIHESLHTLGIKHDKDRPDYLPCNGTATSAGVAIFVKQCTESYCQGLKDQALSFYMGELKYSIGDGRMYQGLCQQWNSIMGVAP